MDLIKDLLKQGKIKEALKKFRALSDDKQEDFFRGLAPTLFPPSMLAVLFRKLHPGKTYKDFHQAWLPPLKEGQDLENYFSVPTYVINAENVEDPTDIISIGLMWVGDKDLSKVMELTKTTESQRHENIDGVAVKIGPTLMYQLKDVNKLGS